MPAIAKPLNAANNLARGKFQGLKFLLLFSLLDGLSAWLLILLYVTGIDIVWLVNANFAAMSTVLIYFAFRKPRISRLMLLFLVAFIISVVKLSLYLGDGRGFEWFHFLTYFQGLIIPFAALCFGSQFSRQDSGEVLEIFNRYSRIFLWLALPGILTYSALYFLGHIAYFGLGANLFYVYPFLAMKGPTLYALFFLVIALITGKRASFVVILVQTLLINYTKFKRSKFWTVLFGLAFFAVGVWIYENTDLLFRFKWIFEADFDFSDPYFLSISGGGRFEEMFGIYEYFQQHPLDALFGSPPGSYYTWTLEWSGGYIATKNHSHITWIGYIFRYGLILTVPLIIYFFYCIYRNLGSSNPFFIAFAGIFSTSFFGALLITDPTSWILIALFLQVYSIPEVGSNRTRAITRPVHDYIHSS